MTWRELREVAGLSIRELEALTGINRGELSHIERGIGPTPRQAWQLLAAPGLRRCVIPPRSA